MYSGNFTVSTTEQMHLIDITHEVQNQIENAEIIETGICYLYNPHTTAGLTINEGTDPDVQTDIINGIREIVPLQFPFRHQEGNSPAHIMTSLMGSSLTIMVDKGRIQLGTWQKIFLCEFDGPRTRKIQWQLLVAA
jgi:secondary thiamine-phosphate synthase enzyme